MRPLKLEVADLFGIREASLDLEATSLVAVTGENGSGKSSLFIDSVHVALFGEPSESRPVTAANLIRSGQKSGRVSLTFRQNGNLWLL